MRIFYIILVLLFLPFLGTAYAVRPFVTDDGRIQEKGQGVFEISGRLSDSKTNLNLVSYSLFNNLEIQIGFATGIDQENKYGVTGPLLQTSFLLMKSKINEQPGIKLSLGVSPPWGLGRGSIVPSSYNEYAYFSITQELLKPEELAFHFNFGVINNNLGQTPMWGIGVQKGIYGKLKGVFEVISGDPYSNAPGGAIHTGLRYFYSDDLQIDLSIGRGVWGDPTIPTWVGFGIRKVFDFPTKKNR